jgi:hypothetical protein
MRLYRYLLFASGMALATTYISAQAQQLYKCSTTSGGTEYRNSPCEKGQRSAGSVNKGTVTTIPPTGSASAVLDTPTPGSSLGLGLGSTLEALKNPIQAMRNDAAPIDKMAFGMCKSEGGHYVQGAGCLSEPPKNKNPAIGEAKMREVCKQSGQHYIQPLNDCVRELKK